MNTEEFQTIITHGVSLDNFTYLLLTIVCTVSGFIGAYISSYAKEKGKNYATKEDFDSLKKQTTELSNITELVKSEVANNSWVSSKKWELKFKIYTDVLESLSVWRMSIYKVNNELYDSKGKLNEKANKKKLEVISKEVQSIFMNLAKIEAIVEVALSSEQSKKIRRIKELATKETHNLGVNKAFILTIEKIKELEMELAKEAKQELFK